jgi:hypothetical protein
VSTADRTVDRAAAKLQDLADKFAAEGGAKAKLADSLAEDADLIRKMKPSLIKARAKGEAPTGQKPAATTIPPAPERVKSSPKAKKKAGGPNPWVLVGIALAAGIVLARFIEWRGHGYPRD